MADWISEAGGAVRQAHQENAGIIKTVLTMALILIAFVIFLKFVKSFFPSSQTSQPGLLPGMGSNSSSMFGGGGGLLGGGGGLIGSLATNPFINPLALLIKR